MVILERGHCISGFRRTDEKQPTVSEIFPPLVINSVFRRRMVLPLAIISLRVRKVWHVMEAFAKWFLWFTDCYCWVDILAYQLVYRIIVIQFVLYKSGQEKLDKYLCHSFVIYGTAKYSWAKGRCTPDNSTVCLGPKRRLNFKLKARVLLLGKQKDRNTGLNTFPVCINQQVLQSIL